MTGKPWLKLWTETLHDRKLLRVIPAWRWCWCSCLMLAAEQDNHGRLELAPGVPLGDDDSADSIGVSLEVWTQARDYFLSLGMMTRDGMTLIIAKYDERQASTDPTHAERQKRYRDSHALASRDASLVLSQVRVEEETEAEAEAEAEKRDEQWTIAMKLFENNISLVSGSILPDMLDMWEVLKSADQVDWWEQAIKVTASANRRSWSYMRGVLQRCLSEGHPPLPGTNGTGKPTKKEPKRHLEENAAGQLVAVEDK